MKGLMVRLYCRIRFGLVTEEIKGKECNVVSEIEFRDRNGDVIGEWCFGYFNPYLPFGETCYKYASLNEGKK